MAALSGVFSVQQLTDLGGPLIGGRLYTYAYGTTTQKLAYTDIDGTIVHTYTSDGAGGQYIALNARGELPAPLYLGVGSYDLALKRADGSTVFTRRAEATAKASDVVDFASTSDPTKGAALIGFDGFTLPLFFKDRNILVVAAVAAIRAIDKTKYTKARTLGYSTAGKGAGFYYLDAADTSTADNNGTIIVSGDNGRWKLIHDGRVTAAQFGADSTNTADAAPRLQQMIDWCQQNDVIPCLEPKGQYKLLAGLTFKHGKNSTDARSYHPILEGNGASLRPVGTFKGFHIQPRCLLADAATGRGVAVTNITSLEIDGAGATGACQAYVIGIAGYACDSFTASRVEVLVLNYSTTNAVHYLECRKITSRLVMRAGTLLIEAQTENSFVGDFIFEGFEGSGTNSVRPINITTGSGNTNGQARGIRFVTPTIYGSGTLLSAVGRGKVGDIWFISPQFDGPAAPTGETAFSVNGSDSAELFQIHLEDPYIVNYTGLAVRAETSGTATLYQCDITGGGISQITCNASNGNSAVFAFGCEGFAVESVDFDRIIGVNGSSCYINIDTCTNVRVCDNTGTRANSVVNGVTVGGGNTHIITGNMINCSGSVVNDYTGGTPTRLVTNNLKT